MTNYWLLGTTMENFNIARKRAFDVECFHDLYEKRVKMVKHNDGLVYYIWKCCKFGAITEAVGNYFFDDNPDHRIFIGLPKNPSEIYPHRFETSPKFIPKSEELIDVETFQSSLSFITPKQRAYNWKLAFRPSLQPLPQEDYQFIKSAMKKSGYYKEVNPY